MTLPLSGLLVVSLEQAVAAPMCSCKLADAGARVIKIERPEGDFARTYDTLAHGECSYFVWLNRGKELVVLDLTTAADRALLAAMLKRADVFVQNLKPGAIEKLGFPIAELRRELPRLICCSISGFGETGPYAARKAYDLLIQAEFGSRRDYRHERTGAGRGIRRRYHDRLECLSIDPRSLDRARAHRRRCRAFGLDVRLHGRLDGRAAVAI